jgi:hypothetical protein
MTLRVLLALLALVFCFQAEAGEWRAYGWGPESCGAWTNVEAQRPQVKSNGMMFGGGSEVAAQTQWVLGFVSAFNLYQGPTPDLLHNVDADSVFAWIDNYCASHPLNRISTATIALILDLSKRQLGPIPE